MTTEANSKLESDFGERTINEFQLMFRNGQINLDPGFQRKSVWSLRDRRRLIQSIVSNYPLPSVFLYRRNSRGKLVYDVIDGKQQLETIFMFTRQGRFKRDWFDVRLELNEDEGLDWWNWRDIRRYHGHVRHAIESYKIQTVEVTGSLSEIIDLFVRINSTGKRLTSGEKRHARFYDSRFLKEAAWLVARFQNYFLREGILSRTQLDRMKGTELVAELLMSIHQGGVINKKTSLDRAIGNDSINAHTLSRVSRELVATVNTLKRLFPEIATTRFHNTVDYYSLVMLVWEMRNLGFVLTNNKRNQIATRLLRRLSNGVDELRVQLKRAKPAANTPQIYSDYLLTVQGDTDSAATRERRREILKGLLFSLFDYKDDQRTFTPEQRRILWNSDEKRLCANRRCPNGRILTWDDFTVDHVKAWIKGGATKVENAQLMCRSCNSAKGGR
jgi:hypothetical protein